MQYFGEFGLGEVIDHWRMVLVPMLLRAPKRGTLAGMRAKIYGALVAKPIRFPGEIQMLIFPLRSEDQSHIGAGSWPSDEREPWEAIKRRYPVNEETEQRIRSGENVSVFVGSITFNPPDGTVFPDGCEVEVLKD
jgi:hypothetical protein